jgi:hypothetical protein
VVFDRTFFGAVRLTRLSGRLRTNLQPECRMARPAEGVGSPFLQSTINYSSSAGPRLGGIDPVQDESLVVGPEGAVATVVAGSEGVQVEHRLTVTTGVEFAARMENTTDATGTYAQRVVDVRATSQALSGNQSARGLGGDDGCYSADAADGRLDAQFDSIGPLALTGAPPPGAETDLSVCVARGE